MEISRAEALLLVKLLSIMSEDDHATVNVSSFDVEELQEYLEDQLTAEPDEDDDEDPVDLHGDD